VEGQERAGFGNRKDVHGSFSALAEIASVEKVNMQVVLSSFSVRRAENLAASLQHVSKSDYVEGSQR
jgi:hypothetical protein